MKRFTTPAIFFLFILQLGFLLYEQRAASDRSLQLMDSEMKRLTDEGVPRNQAIAVVSAISSAHGSTTSALWNVGFITSFTSFMMIITLAPNRLEKAPQT